MKEIDPKTMASRKMESLYFCDEILGFHGYNIFAAFVTSHAADVAATRS